MATLADDTAILASHKNHLAASRMIQTHQNFLSNWFKKWRIKVNEVKQLM